MRRLLLSLLCAMPLIGSQHDYQISVSNHHQSATIVNGTRSYCDCGRSPVLVMVLYGHLFLYCEEHMPELEVVRRVTPENLTEIIGKDQ